MFVRRRAAVRLLALVAATPLMLGSVGLRTSFDERVLAAHNRERSAVAVPTLAWDPRLAREAKVWADHLSRSGRFEHSPDPAGRPPEGENLWGGTPGHYVPEAMVGLWIAEKSHFRPGVFPATSRTGQVDDVSHYTQLVWRRTTHVGCASSAVGKEEILVCRYSTAGNVLGQTVL